jgi:exosome complex RNA-binding protein Rrp42 (RNase PH superfamily)
VSHEMLDRLNVRTSFWVCREDRSLEVQLGQAQVLALVKGEIMQPYPDQRNEGSMSIVTEFSSMGNLVFEPRRPSDMVVELGRTIDYRLR